MTIVIDTKTRGGVFIAAFAISIFGVLAIGGLCMAVANVGMFKALVAACLVVAFFVMWLFPAVRY